MSEFDTVKDEVPPNRAKIDINDDDVSLEDSWNDFGTLIKAGLLPPRADAQNIQNWKDSIELSKSRELDINKQQSSSSVILEGMLPREPIARELAYILVDDDELAEIDAILYEEGVPDNVEYARTDCVYEFLEQYLLPRMLDQRELKERELLVKAYDHKKAFKEKHPEDFWDGQGYQFLPSVGFALTQLEIYFGVGGQWNEPKDNIPKLVWRAAKAYRQLDLNVLYGMG